MVAGAVLAATTMQTAQNPPFSALLLPWLLVLPHTLGAQEPAAPAGFGIAGSALTRVHVDQPGDGNVWVLAKGYKARFGRAGSEFIPYFGARAPRHFGVGLRLVSVRRGERSVPLDLNTAPEVHDLQVTYRRGLVQEVWDLRDQEVEHSYFLECPDGTGDLSVRLALSSELVATPTTTGIEFVHQELGRVEYGAVVTRDAGGRRVETLPRLVRDADGSMAIELYVPEAFLATATGQLTIDPIVKAVAVDTGTDQNGDPDVAFEPTTRNWLVAYVRSFSVNDADIISRRFTADGTFLEETVVATGSRESRSPSVGANGPARQFLIAWDEDTAIADRVIYGRTRDAASTVQSPAKVLLDTSGVGNDDFGPDVGGSIATDASGSLYAVVCTSTINSAQVISWLRVTTGLSVTSGILSGVSQFGSFGRISKVRPTNGVWCATFLVASGSGQRVMATVLQPTGTLLPNAVVDNNAVCGEGDIAGDGKDFFVVHSRSVGAGNSDIIGTRLRLGISLAVISQANLTQIEPGAVPSRDQVRPRVAFDGTRYTYAYQEAVGAAGSFDLFGAVLSLTSPLFFSDGHRALHAASTAVESDLAIAATGEMGGEAARSFLVYMRISSGNVDVAGLLFDGTSPNGGITSKATGCGGHALTAASIPAIGGTLDLRATRVNAASQVFLIGLPTAGVKLCAASCALGVNPILVTVPGHTIDLPIPPDVGLIGGTLAVQNALLNGVGGCAPPTFPVTLTVSNTLVVTLQ